MLNFRRRACGSTGAGPLNQVLPSTKAVPLPVACEAEFGCMTLAQGGAGPRRFVRSQPGTRMILLRYAQTVWIHV